METYRNFQTKLIDRMQEVAAIQRQLADPACRLVTLVGMGGVGKSRLAAEIVRCAAASYPHGVWMVELAVVTTPSDLPLTIAATLGLQLNHNQGTPAEQVFSFVQDRRLLLVLDNLEHLLNAVPWIQELLQCAPQLQILVTSRETLNLPGERIYEIRGLPVLAAVRPDGFEPTGALALFVDRARYVQPEFSLNADNLHSISQICRLVEGLPLGIELAAAWVRALSTDTLLAHLEQSLDLLASRSRDAHPRHYSLRATFEQSWSLLAPAEQTLLRRLTVLRGRFSFAVCQHVAGATIGDLAALVDKSMVQTLTDGRYGLHPVIREFAYNKLAEVPILLNESLEQHATYFLCHLAEQLPHLKGSGMVTALAAIESTLDNVRSAWQYAIQNQRADLLLLAVDGLGYFFMIREQPSTFLEMYRWAVENWLVDEQTPMALPVRGRLLAWLGVAYSLNDDPQQGLVYLQQSLTLQRTLHDRSGLAFALWGIVMIYATIMTSEPIEGYLPLADEASAIYRELGDNFGLANSLRLVGNKFNSLGQPERARGFLEESLRLGRQLSNPYIIITTSYLLSYLELYQGNLMVARRLCEENLHSAKALHAVHATGQVLKLLTIIVSRQGEGLLARQYAREGLELARAQGSTNSVITALNLIGTTERHFGDLAEGRAALYHALELAEASNLTEARSMTYLNLVPLVCAERNYDEGRRLTEKALQLACKSGNIKLIATLLNNWGFYVYESGDFVEAQRLCQEALEIWTQHALPISGFPSVLINLGHITTALGKKIEALRMFQQALQLCWQQKQLALMLEAVVGLARLFMVSGRYEYPVELLAFVAHRPERTDTIRRMSASLLANLQQWLAANTFKAAFERGKSFQPEMVVESLLTHSQVIVSGVAPDFPAADNSGLALTDPLSQRELEVLRLVAQGLSNHDIAQRLFVAVGTVKTHVWKIREKLGAKNRTQAVERARQYNIL